MERAAKTDRHRRPKKQKTGYSGLEGEVDKNILIMFKLFQHIKIKKKDLPLVIGGLTVGASLTGLIFTVIQINDSRKVNAAEISLNLTRDIYSNIQYKNNPVLIKLINQGKPILRENGGIYDEEDLDNLLSQWDMIARLNQQGLLPFDVLYSQFSFDLEQAYKNQEVMSYIHKIRVKYNDTTFYSDFEWLAQWVTETTAQK